MTARAPQQSFAPHYARVKYKYESKLRWGAWIGIKRP